MATRTPYTRDANARFTTIETDVTVLESGELSLKLPINFAVTNVASGQSQALTGTVPAGALITSVSVFVDETVSGTTTLAFSCESSGDLDAAIDLSGVSQYGVSPGVPRPNDETTWVYTSALCTPYVEAGSGTDHVLGRLVYLLGYILPE